FIIPCCDLRAFVMGLRWARVLELVIFLVLWCVLAWGIFYQSSTAVHYFSPYMLVALLTWPALRFGPLGVVLAMVLLAGISFSSPSVHVASLFWGGETLQERLLVVQIYIAFTVTTGMLLAASYDERRRAEAALKEAERFSRAAIDALSAQLAVVDETGTILIVNDAWRRFARANASTIAGLLDGENYLAVCARSAAAGCEEAAAFIAGFHAILRGAQDDFMWEYPCHTLTERYWFIVRMTRFSVGGPVRIVVTHQDITERKLAEETIKNSEAQLREIINVSPVPMALNDAQLNITFLNPAFIQTFGYTLEDIPTVAAWWPKAYPDPAYQKSVAAAWLAEMNAMKASGVAFSPMEVNVTCKDGRTKTVLVSANMALGSFAGNHLVMLYDITERKLAENALEKAKAAAEAANKAKSEFLSNIAHDFRTPIHAIMGFGALLESQDLPVKPLKFAQNITRSAQNLLALVDDLLDVTRLESGKIPLRSLDLDMKECIKIAVDQVQIGLLDKDVKLSCRVGDDIPYLKGDITRLNQILVNLIGNAVKYTDKGEINVKVERVPQFCSKDKCRVNISVKDTGFGISPECQGRIFDAFTRFHEFEGGKKRSGLGLGMYITKAIVDLMKGKINIISQVGVGSEFIVTLDLDVASSLTGDRDAESVAGR
ncbi:MAG: PAS domain-containing sensor histidine kinase, partial [Candidatus Omnitrophica bacterium]|nr:PAS domain-containing sensor histidine kinase [Candidatus Omnitrophota bacterium]